MSIIDNKEKKDYDNFKQQQSWNYSKNIDDSNIKLYECFINPGCSNLMTKPKEITLHHAHVFFKKSIFNDIKYIYLRFIASQQKDLKLLFLIPANKTLEPD